MGDVTNEVTAEDRAFLLRQINQQMNLSKPLSEDDIIAERCGVRPLVTSGGNSDEIDWHKLSRKHVVELDQAHAAVTLFGGKLTDCLNVGEEVLAAVSKLGVTAKHKPVQWFGEDSAEDMEKFLAQAAKVMPESEAREHIASGIWRRHGNRGYDILQAIQQDASGATAVFDGLDICQAEVSHVLRFESVLTAEDLLRRRLPISMSRSEGEIESNEFLQSALKPLQKPNARVA